VFAQRAIQGTLFVLQCEGKAKPNDEWEERLMRKQNIQRTLAFLLAAVLTLAYILPVRTFAADPGDPGAILQAIAYWNDRHNGAGSLTAEVTGDTVTVTGSVANADSGLTLWIDAGVTVIWKAEVTFGRFGVTVNGEGTFEMAGGYIKHLGNGRAISLLNGSPTLNVTGGVLEAPSGDNPGTIYISTPSVVSISGGRVTSTGDDGATIYAGRDGCEIHVSGEATVVEALGYNSDAIYVYTLTDNCVVSVTDATVTSAEGFAINAYRDLTIPNAIPEGAAEITVGGTAEVSAGTTGCSAICTSGNITVGGSAKVSSDSDDYYSVWVDAEIETTVTVLDEAEIGSAWCSAIYTNGGVRVGGTATVWSTSEGFPTIWGGGDYEITVEDEADVSFTGTDTNTIYAAGDVTVRGKAKVSNSSNSPTIWTPAGTEVSVEDEAEVSSTGYANTINTEGNLTIGGNARVIGLGDYNVVYGGATSQITLEGGLISVYPYSWAIGSANPAADAVRITGSAVINGTVNANATVAQGGTLTIREPDTLTINKTDSDSYTLTNHGTIVNTGEIQNLGTIHNKLGAKFDTALGNVTSSPVIGTIAVSDGQTNTPYSVSFTTLPGKGGNADTWSGPASFNGLTFTASTATLAGIPESKGASEFSVSASSDPDGGTFTQDYVLIVNSGQETPNPTPNPSPAPNPKPAPNPNPPASPEKAFTVPADGGKVIQVPAELADEKVTVKPTNTHMDTLIRDAKNTAEDAEDAEDAVPTVTFDLSAVAEANAAALDTTLANQFADAGVSVTVKFPAGEVTLSPAALSELTETQTGLTPLTAELRRVPLQELKGMQLAQVKGYETVVSIDLFVGDEKGEAPVTIRLPYTLKDGEDPAGVCVWHLSDNGKLTRLDSSYSNGMITFVSSRRSYHVVGYDPVALWTNVFSDVSESAWYYDAVAYGNHYGLFVGNGGRFMPDDSMTRAMFATVLWNLEGTPAPALSANFGDIPVGAWYHDAVVWAAENGIVVGTGGGKFSPDTTISRQEMALMLLNYATFKAYTIPHHREAPDYSDTAQIAVWAESAAKELSEAGVMEGNNNEFMPRKAANRAEAAQLIQNFLRLIAGFCIP
jgi:hypothetical protein